MPIEFDNLKFNSNEPVYQQVIKHFKKNMMLGNLIDGEEIPSRRVLAVILAINPATVQKVYRQLESENLIQTFPSSKSCVTLNSQKIESIKKQMTEEYTEKFLHELKSCGLDFKQTINLITSLWDKC